MRAALTDDIVRAIAPRADGELVVSDTETRGLRLKITPAGNRTWFCQYRATDGRQKKLTLGSALDVPVKVARDLYVAAMKKVETGRDPQAEKMETAVLVDREPTLAEAWTLYEQRFLVRNVKDGTLAERKRLWEREVPVALKKKCLADVTKQADPLERNRRVSRNDLLELQERMASRPGVANHLFRILKAFFNWCEGDGQLVAPHSNPLHKVKLLKLKTRHFVFDPVALQKLAHALAAEEERGWPPIVQAIWFLMMTGFRMEEALKLRWENIDLEKRRIKLPDTKTGEAVRVIGAGAVEVLEQAQRFQMAFASPYVFPSPRDRSQPIQNIRATLRRACEAAGIPYGTKSGGVWVHGLRHNFGGMSAAITNNALLVRDMMGHADLTTTSGYMKAADQTLRDAADDTTAAIRQAATGNVVRIKR